MTETESQVVRVDLAARDLIEKLDRRWSRVRKVVVEKDVISRALLVCAVGFDYGDVEMLEALSSAWQVDWDKTIEGLDLLMRRELLDPDSRFAKGQKELNQELLSVSQKYQDKQHPKVAEERQLLIQRHQIQARREILRQEYDKVKAMQALFSEQAEKEPPKRKRSKK